MLDPALLAAVLADPADDLPRLVLCDWLEEHGEAERAAFIRVQCELARLCAGADEPTGDRMHEIEAAWVARDGRIAALRRRERALLIRSQKWWKMPGCECSLVIDNFEVPVGSTVGFHWNHREAGSVRFIPRRGFIDQITLSWPDWLAHDKAIRESQPVTVVTLTYPPDEDTLNALLGSRDFLEAMAPAELFPQQTKVALETLWPGITFTVRPLPTIFRGVPLEWVDQLDVAAGR